MSTYNIHTFVNGVDAYVSVPDTVSANDAAAAVVDAINALALPGVTASLTDSNVLVVDGAYSLKCNIGGVGSNKRTVAHVRQPIQATVYAPDPKTRAIIGEIIRLNVGTSDTHHLYMSDGEQLYVEIGSASAYREKAQSSYSAFEYHMFFEVEYPITPVAPVSQVGAIENVVSVGLNPQALLETVWVG